MAIVNIVGTYDYIGAPDWGGRNSNDVIYAEIELPNGSFATYDTINNGSLNAGTGEFEIQTTDPDVGVPILFTIYSANHTPVDGTFNVSNSGETVTEDQFGTGVVQPILTANIPQPSVTIGDLGNYYIDDVVGDDSDAEGYPENSISKNYNTIINVFDGYGGNAATITEYDWSINDESYGTLTTSGPGFTFIANDITDNSISQRNVDIDLQLKVTSLNPLNQGLVSEWSSTAGQQGHTDITIVNRSYIPYEYGCTLTNDGSGNVPLNYYCTINNSNDGVYCINGAHTMWVQPCNGDNSCCNFEPIVDFTWTNTAGSPVVVFSDNTSDPNIDLFDDDILSYSWNFGDGNTSTEQNPTHVYNINADGTDFSVTLTVTDSQQNAISATESIVLSLDGCLDSEASNTTAGATDDDGSCIYDGCFYDESSVTNYYCDSHADAYICNGTYQLIVNTNAFDNNSCSFVDVIDDNETWLNSYLTTDEDNDADAVNYNGASFVSLDDYLISKINDTPAITGSYLDDTSTLFRTGCQPNDGLFTEDGCLSNFDTLISKLECGDSDEAGGGEWCIDGECDTCADLSDDNYYPCTNAYYGSWCVGDNDDYTIGGQGDFTLTTECEETLNNPAIYIMNGQINVISYYLNDTQNVGETMELSWFSENPDITSGGSYNCGQFTYNTVDYENCLNNIRSVSTIPNDITISRNAYTDINNLKTGFTQLSEQFGWVGQLEDFDPSIGYWIQTPVSGWIKFRYTN